MNTLKIISIFGLMSLASLSAAIITPAFPLLQHDFAVSVKTLQLLVSLFLVGYLIGQFIYPLIAHFKSCKTALNIGFIINALGIAMCLFAAHIMNFNLLLTGRFLTALGSSVGLSTSFILLNQNFTMEKARKMLPYAIFSFTGAIGIATLIGGFLTQYAAWQDSFWVLLGYGFLQWGLIFVFDKTSSVKTKQTLTQTLTEFSRAFKHKTLWTYSLFVAVASAFSYGYSVVAPLYTHTNFHLSAGLYGIYNLFTIMGMILGTLIVRKLQKKWQDKKIILFASMLLVVLLLILAAFDLLHILTLYWFFMAMMFCYLLTSLLFPCASHLASNAIDNKASASGVMNVINMVFAVLSVFLLGSLHTNLLLALIAITLVLLLFAVFYFFKSR